jgi:hypothetical protein
MQANTNCMNQPWDPNTSFEMLIDQTKECSEMADAGNQPMSDQQIVNAPFTLVFNTGMFFDDCKSWNRKDPADQTWINFKTHFIDAQRFLQQQQQTSTASGYHANAAIHEHQHNQYNEAAAALANLATATAKPSLPLSPTTPS